MRQLTITLLFIFILFTGTFSPAFSAIKGKIDYSIPIDYSKINEQELKQVASEYFYNAEKLQEGVINDDMTNALMLYSVLQSVNPENIEYPIRLGILYDKLKKDRHAKGNFSKAIGINNTNALNLNGESIILLRAANILRDVLRISWNPSVSAKIVRVVLRRMMNNGT